MKLSDALLALTQSKRMLNHPFYQAWERGELSSETLKTYGRQYYHHVKALPRYISATHSQCADLSSRQVLLENLIDEERGAGHHPGRWMRFATGLGQTSTEVEGEVPFMETQNLVDDFMDTAKSSYAAGLAALFVYEQQFPDVAKTKASGLRRFYGISDDQTLDYFILHAEVDVEHAAQTRALVDALPEEDRSEAERGAQQASEALWRFLSRMQREHSPAACCAC